MLEEGKTFVRDGKTFCLIKLLYYNLENYAIFSVESDKLSFEVFKVVDVGDRYDFTKVTDEQLKFSLFELIEREGD